MSWRERWARGTLLDRTVTITAVVFVLAGAVSRPLWRTLHQRLAVTIRYRSNAATDPWGSPWQRPDAIRIHSPGPNRVYEQGGGDDVLVLPPDSVEVYLYSWAPYALVLFGVAFGLTYRMARGEERTGFSDELGRSVVTAVPLGAYAVGLAVVLSVPRGMYPPVLDPLAFAKISPVGTPVLLSAAAYACSVMFVLAVRLSQPVLKTSGDFSHYVGFDTPAGAP